jgi:hypothetical protein
MRKTILTIACLIMLITSYSTSQDQVRISINKNEQGEMMFKVSGHTTPVVLEVNGKAVTVDVDKSEVNMEHAFAINYFSSKEAEDIDTAAGTETAAGNNAPTGSGAGAISGSQQFNPQLNPQFNPNLVPPVNSKPNPLEATPI